ILKAHGAVFAPRPDAHRVAIDRRFEHRPQARAVVLGRIGHGEEPLELCRHAVEASVGLGSPTSAKRPRRTLKVLNSTVEGSRCRSIALKPAAFVGSSDAKASHTTMRPPLRHTRTISASAHAGCSK